MLFHLYMHPVRSQMVHTDHANTYSKRRGYHNRLGACVRAPDLVFTPQEPFRRYAPNRRVRMDNDMYLLFKHRGRRP